MSEGGPALSLVIPLYNEAESLEELHTALTAVLRPYGDRCEVIYVDDGSTDGSFDCLKKLRDADPRVTIIRLRCNQGKTVALVAGFREARGEVVITMDADLQDDPLEIPRLLGRLEEGYDLVSGWKVNRQDPWSRRVLSRLFNAVTSRVTGVNLHDLNCGFKAYRRAVIAELRLQGDLHRFIPRPGGRARLQGRGGRGPAPSTSVRPIKVRSCPDHTRLLRPADGPAADALYDPPAASVRAGRRAAGSGRGRHRRISVGRLAARGVDRRSAIVPTRGVDGGRRASTGLVGVAGRDDRVRVEPGVPASHRPSPEVDLDKRRLPAIVSPTFRSGAVL
ncbi:MAG: glycosyltransferase family 2 protein [Candidatus Methylomirabilis sp.]|nr:glycosyltransferase family 2 protein [Candidatus Methylomirabilis sp.]